MARSPGSERGTGSTPNGRVVGTGVDVFRLPPDRTPDTLRTLVTLSRGSLFGALLAHSRVRCYASSLFETGRNLNRLNADGASGKAHIFSRALKLRRPALDNHYRRDSGRRRGQHYPGCTAAPPRLGDAMTRSRGAVFVLMLVAGVSAGCSKRIPAAATSPLGSAPAAMQPSTRPAVVENTLAAPAPAPLTEDDLFAAQDAG